MRNIRVLAVLAAFAAAPAATAWADPEPADAPAQPQASAPADNNAANEAGRSPQSDETQALPAQDVPAEAPAQPVASSGQNPQQQYPQQRYQQQPQDPGVGLVNLIGSAGTSALNAGMNLLGTSLPSLHP